MLNNNFYKIIKHDLTEGVRQNLLKYALSAFLFSFIIVMFFNGINASQSSQLPLPKGSFLDCAIYVFKGMRVYIPSSEEPFVIPIEWMMIQIMVAFLILSYPTNDLHSYGIQLLTRTKNRSMWWISKCIWNIFTTVLFYIISILTILSFTFIFGELSFIPNYELNMLFNEIDIQLLKTSQLLFIVFVLPVLTSIAFSLLQMTLSFIITPIFSYMIIVCILIASAYFCIPVFIGNFSMLLRNQLAYPPGTGSLTAVIINISIIIISIIIGFLHFNRCDILRKS